MQNQSQWISEFEGFTVWEIGCDLADRFTDFVFEVYYGRFSNRYGWKGREYDKMAEDDRRTLPHSRIFAALSYDDEIVASTRITQRQDEPLLVEEDFGVDAEALCRRKNIRYRRVFEAGRFAKSDRAAAAAGLSAAAASRAVDGIIAAAVQSSIQYRNSVWLASIDAMVLKLLQRRGLAFEPIGATRTYLGSPTTPVVLDLDRCRARAKRHHPDCYRKYFDASWLSQGDQILAHVA